MPGSTALSENWPRPLELALRLAFTYGLLLWLAARYDRSFVEALLPLLAGAVSALDDSYRVLAISTGMEGPDSVLRLRANLAHALVIGGRAILPDPRGWLEGTTTIGTVLQPLVSALGLVLAWPARRAAIMLWRLALAPVVLCAALLMDTPFVLWAYLWGPFVTAYEPGRFSPLLLWEGFLSNGGHVALGLVGAGMITWGADRLARGQRK